MKQLLYIVLFLSCTAFAQQEKDSIIINNRIYYSGETYLDSVKIDVDKTYLNPKNIASVNKILGTDSQIYRSTNGITFITRKMKDNLISFAEVISSVRKSSKIYEAEKNNLVVNGVLIQNPEEYLIETTYIKKLEILKDEPKLKGDHLYRNPTIRITTKSD
ncbi:hypothetical protein ACLI09_08970 [Flavobacterium sp. RHBU_24]|uniref:hypothetical protein n=1 Tax=Flavobacterium sp. RHBU_24 TaxID=3391185 RepID=UPI0039851447